MTCQWVCLKRVVDPQLAIVVDHLSHQSHITIQTFRDTHPLFVVEIPWRHPMKILCHLWDFNSQLGNFSKTQWTWDISPTMIGRDVHGNLGYSPIWREMFRTKTSEKCHIAKQWKYPQQKFPFMTGWSYEMVVKWLNITQLLRKKQQQLQQPPWYPQYNWYSVHIPYIRTNY